MADTEVWKDIPGFVGYYQASNKGRIRGVDRILSRNCGGTKFQRGKIINPYISKWGYLQVRLSKNGITKHYGVSRLVYAAFNGEIPEGKEINHIDENKLNNNLSNLEAVTKSENINWGTRNNRAAKKMAMPVYQCLNDGTEIFMWFSIAYASEDLHIKDSNISQCCKGKRNSAGGFKWCYAS